MVNPIDLSKMLLSPSWAHPLGTDSLGRDLVGRVGLTLLETILPLWSAVVVAWLVGLGLGIGSVLLREQRVGHAIAAMGAGLATLICAIPAGILVFAMAVWQEKSQFAQVMVCLGVLFALRQMLRVDELYLHDRDLGFWQARRALGGRLAGQLWRYGILGLWRAALLRELAFHLQAALIIESSLSYLGFGVQEPQPSFGNILASHYDALLKGRALHLLFTVGLFATTLAIPRLLLAAESLLSAGAGKKRGAAAAGPLAAVPPSTALQDRALPRSHR